MSKKGGKGKRYNTYRCTHKGCNYDKDRWYRMEKHFVRKHQRAISCFVVRKSDNFILDTKSGTVTVVEDSNKENTNTHSTHSSHSTHSENITNSNSVTTCDLSTKTETAQEERLRRLNEQLVFQ